MEGRSRLSPIRACEPEERDCLRSLAGRVAEIAAEPRHEALRRRWIEHNGLRDKVPLVQAFPEGSWLECIPPEDMVCHDDPLLYGWEQRLRMAIYMHEVLQDDCPIDAVFNVCWHGAHTGWGLKVRIDRAEGCADADIKRRYHLHPAWDLTQQCARDMGAYHMQPAITELSDIERLTPNLFVPDHAETTRRVALADEIFGDLLDVRTAGWLWVGSGVAANAVHFRGLAQLMMDCFDRPGWVHEYVARIAQCVETATLQLEADGCLSPNSGYEWIGTGGIGCTDELPADDAQPGRTRLKDMWGMAQTQDLTGFSPAMVEEFFLPHIKPLMERFGLTYFGCCEPVHDIADAIKGLPRLRRISISPWTDVPRAAERFGGDYVLAYKPNPACIATEAVDEAAIRAGLVEAFEHFRTNGCVVDVAIKDLHTVQDEPRRIARWVELAREAIDDVYG